MGITAIKKWSGIKNTKRKVWCASLLIAILLSGCANPIPSAVSTPAPDTRPVAGTVQDETKPADPVVLKYYNYFVERHTLVDNRIFTVNENTLQDDVICFAFMNTEPADGKPANTRTVKQIDDVLMKYFGIKPKRYSTGISGMTANGDVQLGSVTEDVVRVHRLLLKQLTANGNGSCSAVFKLYQIWTDRALPDFDRRILEGDPEMGGIIRGREGDLHRDPGGRVILFKIQRIYADTP